VRAAERTPQGRPRDPSPTTATLAIVAAVNAELVDDQASEGEPREDGRG
jgi:hypothetical protein